MSGVPLPAVPGETLKEKIATVAQMAINLYLDLARQHGFLHVSSPGTLVALPTNWLHITCNVESHDAMGLRWSFTTAETHKAERDAIVAGIDALISEFGADVAASALKECSCRNEG